MSFATYYKEQKGSMSIQVSILGRLGMGVLALVSMVALASPAQAEQPQGKVVNPATLAQDALNKGHEAKAKADARVDAATKQADEALSDAEDELAAEEEELDEEFDAAEEEAEKAKH